MSAHHTPEEIRKSLTHPVVDGDGHWVEYGPVFAEQIRKVTGDLGANGFLQSQRRGPDSLGMTPEQRAERGVAMEGFWGRQSTNTRDRATAMMPRILYERLDDLGIDFSVVYPTAGLCFHRMPTTRPAARSSAASTSSPPTSSGTSGIASSRPRSSRCTRPRRRSRSWSSSPAARLQGGHGRRPHAPPDPAREGSPRRPRPLCRVVRPSGSTASTTTTRCGRSAASSGGADLPQRRPLHGCATRRPTSATTTSATSPRPATPSPRPSSSAA